MLITLKIDSSNFSKYINTLHIERIGKMFHCLPEQKNNEDRKANKRLRKLSHEEQTEMERQRNEEMQRERDMQQHEAQRKEEYKKKKEQERKEYEIKKELERRKENEELRRQEEQRLRRAEVLQRVKEWHRRAEEQRRIQEEQQRIQEEQQRIQEEQQRIQRQLLCNQILNKELYDLQLKYPNEPYRSCVLKLCKKYHPDKNPNADPEYIRILNHMKELLA
jgi:hypothetical protein